MAGTLLLMQQQWRKKAQQQQQQQETELFFPIRVQIQSKEKASQVQCSECTNKPVVPCIVCMQLIYCSAKCRGETWPSHKRACPKWK